MNLFEQTIKNRLMEEVGGDSGLKEIVCGFQLKVICHGRAKAFLEFGKTYPYYDLASLTKIIFTTSLLMEFVDEDRLDLKSKVSDHLPWYENSGARVENLLKHNAGNDWWYPFYKKLYGVPKISLRWEKLREIIESRKTHWPTSKSVYSDIDFLLLGFVLESITGESLLDLWTQYNRKMKFKDFHFNVKNKPLYSRKLYAPTERCLWRKKLLQGEVHDDNTWALGGVAPQAGLFGTIDDVTQWGKKLRNSYYGLKPKGLASMKTVRHFTRRSMKPRFGDWGLGFMKPTLGLASCGKYMSPSSFGHTGFTGTSFWFDPKRDLMVVLLSNRVYPSRNNKKFNLLRPKIHDWVCESMKEVF